MQKLSNPNHKVTAIKSISLWNVRALQLAGLIPKHSILMNVEDPSNIYQFNGKEFRSWADPSKTAFDFSNPSFQSYHALVHDQYGLFFGDHAFTCTSYKGESYETADDADTYLYDGEKVIIESYLDVAEMMKKDPSFDDRIPIRYLDENFVASLTEEQKHNFLIMAVPGEAYESSTAFLEICTILTKKLDKVVTLSRMDHILKIAMAISSTYLTYMQAGELDVQLSNRSVDQQQLYMTSYYETLKARHQMSARGLGIIDKHGVLTLNARRELSALTYQMQLYTHRKQEYQEFLDSEYAKLMDEFCQINPDSDIAKQYQKRQNKKNKKSKKK